MTSRNPFLRRILAAMTLCLLTGFGTAFAATGYIGKLDGLTPVSSSQFDAVFGKGGALPKGYSSVYVEPVGVITGHDKSLDAMSDYDRKPMLDYLYTQLTRNLGASFTIADQPGPGVLVVAASFTALTANKPTMTDLNKRPDLDYARSRGIGKAGVQIDLRDGATNELLAALVDYDEGDPLDFNTNQFTQWGDAQQFCRYWARSLAGMLTP